MSCGRGRATAMRSHSQAGAAMSGTGARESDIGPGEPARRDVRDRCSGVHRLTSHDRQHGADEAAPPEPARPILQLALGLDDQPAGAEQRIAEHQGDAGEDRERREAIERAAGEMPALDMEALDEGAQHHALRKGRERASRRRSRGPRRCGARRPGSGTRRRRPRKISASSISRIGKVDRRNDDGEGERKRRQQAEAAEHQPGLVAVPDRRDRVHHQVAGTRDPARNCRACRRRDRSRRAAHRRTPPAPGSAVQIGTRLSVGIMRRASGAAPPTRARAPRSAPAGGRPRRDPSRRPRRAAPHDRAAWKQTPTGIDDQIDRHIEQQRKQPRRRRSSEGDTESAVRSRP